MKRALPWLFLLLFTTRATVHAQCTFPLSLTTSKDYCIGSDLRLTSPHTLKKIVWYHDGQPIDSAFANTSLDTVGTIVADVFMEGICTDDLDNLYAFDGNNYAIKVYKPGNITGAVVAGGHGQGSAANQTFGTETIYVDDQYNIYETDMYNRRIQEWQPGAPAGTTLFDFDQGYLTFEPHATLFDCAHKVFLIHPDDSTLQEWTAGSTTPILYAPLPPLWQGYFGGNIALQKDGAGNILLLDETPNVLWRWNAAAASWTRVYGTDLPANATPKSVIAADFWADGDDTVYILNVSTNRLEKYGPGAQTGIPLFNVSAAGLPYFMALTRDKKGDFFIADQQDHKVLKFKMTAAIDTTFTPAQPGQYYAIAEDILGYTRTTDTVYINTPQNGPPGISITTSATSTPVCTPITFTAQTVNAGPDPLYQWMVSGVRSGANNPVYSNDLFADGDQVYCILSTPTGCTGSLTSDTSNSIALTIDPQGAATVHITASDTLLCQGTPVIFKAAVTNGATQPIFQWLLNGIPIPGDDTAAYHTDSLTDKDVLTCLITSDDACGLAKSNSIPMTVDLPPTIAPGQVFSIKHGQSLTLTPIVEGPVTSWLWTPSTGLSDTTIANPVADPAATTLYQLKITNGACSDTGSILVDVYTPLSIPNAFTPNGDGHNDLLYVLGGPEGSKIEVFTVFNRWGEAVFQTHNAAPGDPTRGWNGYSHGQPATAGTYVYQVLMRYANGTHQTYQGTVILIR